MPNYEVQLDEHSCVTVVVKDARDALDAIALAKEHTDMHNADAHSRELRDEELDTAVSQADAVSQP